MMERAGPHLLPDPDEAWARVTTRWAVPVLPDEVVPLADALGRATAHTLESPIDSPPFDRSAMDGYAVRATDLTLRDDGLGEDARPALVVAGEVPMGRAAHTALGPDQALWVATGSMIPPNADAVVNVERTATVDGRVRVVGPVGLGDNIVRRGEDLRCGETVLEAGRRLRPQDVAVVASLGRTHVTVVRRPRVAVLPTGDELRSPGEDLGPGQIYTSNGYTLAAQVAQAGGQAEVWEPIPDDLAAVTAALREGLTRAEVVLVSGGSSVGVKDLTIPALEALEAEIVVRGVATKPGRPTIAAIVDDRFVVGIPGNPVAAMIAFDLFGRRALERLLRLSPAELAVPRGGAHLTATLDDEIVSRRGRQDYVRVCLRTDGAGGWRAALAPGSSAHLRGMVQGDGLVVVPTAVERIDCGAAVIVTTF